MRTSCSDSLNYTDLPIINYHLGNYDSMAGNCLLLQTRARSPSRTQPRSQKTRRHLNPIIYTYDRKTNERKQPSTMIIIIHTVNNFKSHKLYFLPIYREAVFG